MKFRSFFLPFFATIALAAPVLAAGGIATVNIQQIMHDSTAAKSVKDQLEAKQKAFQAQMSKKEEELQKRGSGTSPKSAPFYPRMLLIRS